MNKYVLIPHEQYESFKTFLADKKDQTFAENNQERVDENKSDNHKVDIFEKIDDNKPEKSKGEKFGSVHSRIINNNKLHKQSENLLDNNLKEFLSTHSSVRSQNKAALTHPLPPPGLPAEVNYSKDNYLSKSRKNGRKIQKGSGANEWIQKWTKNF